MSNLDLDVFNFLTECVMDIVDYDDEITETTSFEDMDLESLDFIEILTMVKKKYGVQISANDFTAHNIVNLSGLSGLITSQMAA